uniref:Uncharacterized protein n=1 Tax=Arundo donax TaxID=35708 RepID=A0A0A9ED07_ARUDO
MKRSHELTQKVNAGRPLTMT